MATKISGMTELQTPAGDEYVPFAKGGKWGKIKLSNLITPSTKTALGLDLVDNTPDAQKPISEAAALALAEKANKVHTHTMTEVSQLPETINEINEDIAEIRNSLEHPSVIAGAAEW